MTLWTSVKSLFREPQQAEPVNVNQLVSEFDTYFRRAFESYLINHILENPDKILKNKAGTYSQKVELYDEMKRLYPEISAHLQTRKLAVANKDWQIEENNAPAEIVEFCDAAIRGINNWHEDVMDMLTALERGYSVMEICWKEKDGKWWPSELYGRDQGDYVFDLEHNLRLKTKAHTYEGEIVPDNKFMVITHSKTRENQYGNSVLQDLYWPYHFWKNASKFWALYIERFGMPTAVGTTTRAAVDPKVIETFKDFMKSLQSNSWALLPKDYEVDFKEPAAGRDNFSPFMSYWDTKVRLVILGQELSTFQAASGNLESNKIGNEVRQEIVVADAKELSYAINQSLIEFMVRLNFAYDGPRPQYRIISEADIDLNMQSQVDERLSRMGFEFGKTYIEETYGVRGPENETDVIKKPESPAPPFGFAEGRWVTIEGKHVFIGENGQILKGGGFLKKQNLRWDLGNSETSAIKKQIQENEDIEVFGLRIDEGKNYQQGDEIQKSRRWENGEPTDEFLPGTSVVKLYRNKGQSLTDNEIEQAIKRAQQYAGDQISLVGGDFAEHGEDEQEAIIKNAKVLAVLKHKKKRQDDFSDINIANRDKLARIAMLRGGDLFNPWTEAIKKKSGTG